RLLADTTVADFVRNAARTAAVKVVTPQPERLRGLLAAPDVRITSGPADTLEVHGTDSAHIGRIAAENAIPLTELTPQAASLEQAFMDLTRDTVEYRARPAHEGATA
ncbi:ABC transporter ATP-binding protein, partial [Streptomyces sp. NPDC056987]